MPAPDQRKFRAAGTPKKERALKGPLDQKIQDWRSARFRAA
jgi:hypothetical protein